MNKIQNILENSKLLLPKKRKVVTESEDIEGHHADNQKPKYPKEIIKPPITRIKVMEEENVEVNGDPKVVTLTQKPETSNTRVARRKSRWFLSILRKGFCTK